MGGYIYGEYREDIDKVYPWIELKESTTMDDLDIMNTETLEYMCKDNNVKIPLEEEYSDEEQKRNIIKDRLIECAKNLDNEIYMKIPSENICGTLPSCNSTSIIGYYDKINNKIILKMKEIESFKLEIDMKF